jgi:hypothetical protein
MAGGPLRLLPTAKIIQIKEFTPVAAQISGRPQGILEAAKYFLAVLPFVGIQESIEKFFG